jgi:hypothetical protein
MNVEIAYWNAAIGRDTSACDYDDFLCGREDVGNVFELAVVLFGYLEDGHGVGTVVSDA